VSSRVGRPNGNRVRRTGVQHRPSASRASGPTILDGESGKSGPGASGDRVDPERMKVVVLIKAAPVLTHDLEETMCVAGIRTDSGDPQWIRLHPVPFRDLADDSKFAKYQTVSLAARRPRSDRRPESWSPVSGSIIPTELMGTENGWAQRRHLVDRLGEARMCDLIEANRSGSGPDTPSLAVVRPIESPRLKITQRDELQLGEWRRRAAGAASRMSLFDDPSVSKPDFEVVPWRFQYEFRCSAPRCNGHRQTIVDWEALALWRHVRHQPDWRDQMRLKFEETLWKGRDTVLFVGNQEQHPVSFLVLGVFWPPAGAAQGLLDL
jgi:hypothetical protein